MHRSEARDRGNCADCGAEVSDTRERAFALGDEGVLCFACSTRRGGKYDELHDHWDQAPDLTGLPGVEAEGGRVWK
jgi:DNA-directed RNA polymerase subunit RPC12/RpoP